MNNYIGRGLAALVLASSIGCAKPQIDTISPALDYGNLFIPNGAHTERIGEKYGPGVNGYGSPIRGVDFGKSVMIERNIPLYTYGMAGCSALVIDAPDIGMHYMFHVQYPQNKRDIEKDLKEKFPNGLEGTAIYVRPGIWTADYTMGEILKALKKAGVEKDRITFIPNDEKDPAPPELLIVGGRLFSKWRFTD